MADNMAKEETSEAPRFSIPPQRIVSVEHPCIVRNIDKGIDMLGGGIALSETLDHASKTSLPLRFVPDGQSILSLNNQANNVLLKITVPKRIGKRKRGSNEPFVPIAEVEAALEAPDLLRSIKDSPDHIEITPIGMIENSHIFRTLPDFIYSTSESTFKSDVKNKLIGQDLETIKTFQLPPQTSRLEDTELFPPPILSTFSLPQTYSYLDRPPNKYRAAAAAAKSNTTTSIPILTVNDIDPTWPIQPPEILPRAPKALADLLSALKSLFKTRQLWTLQGLTKNLPDNTSQSSIEQALPYIAFHIVSGPWSGIYCCYGVDPRTSPLYAAFQTIDDPVEDKSGIQKQQLIDITTPSRVTTFLRSPAAAMRTTCEPIYHGWYEDSTLAKLNAMVHVSASLPEGTTISEEDYEAFIALPSQIGGATRFEDAWKDGAEAGAGTQFETAWQGSTEMLRRLVGEYQRCLAVGEGVVRQRSGVMETQPG